MSVWGSKPFESDSGLDILGEAVVGYADELEHNLRDVRQDMDLYEMHIPLATAGILYALFRHCGHDGISVNDVARWKRNVSNIIKRLDSQGVEEESQLREYRASFMSILSKMTRYVAEGDLGFAKRYDQRCMEKYGKKFPPYAADQ